jgi:hypothetical protein
MDRKASRSAQFRKVEDLKARYVTMPEEKRARLFKEIDIARFNDWDLMLDTFTWYDEGETMKQMRRLDAPISEESLADLVDVTHREMAVALGNLELEGKVLKTVDGWVLPLMRKAKKTKF